MPGSPHDPVPADLPARVDACFDPSGPLAARLPDFEVRAAQLEMARTVAGTLRDGGIALLEAGTGTGKTLAYLVPAILSGRRVLVSTGTKNLQEQISEKDLPVLAQIVGRPFTATVMKGRANYLCLHRFRALQDGGLPRQQALALSPSTRQVDERILLPIIERWAAQTETGDRAELTDLPDGLPLWNEICATSENCPGTACAEYADCFLTRMRQRAAESDLVIVNHHLLCADAAVRQSEFGAVIPDRDVAIVDEAHQLEDVITQYFGVIVSSYRLEELEHDVIRALEAWPDPERRESIRRMTALVQNRARSFFDALRPTRGPGEERVRVTPEALADVQEAGETLLGVLDGLQAALQLLKDAPTPEASAVRPAVLDDLLALAGRTEDIRRDLAFLLRAADPDFVFFLEARGRGVFLRAAPIDVSRIAREQIFDLFSSVVLTSATLAVDGSFRYVKERLGIGQAVERRLASEFDYTRQTVLYLPRRMPAPRQPGFADAVATECLEILRRSEGRAFVLFTSYAVLRKVEPVLRTALPYPVLVQGEGPRSALIGRFRSTPNAVLLATSSFWQGVDVVGPQLSCVIIDKLPFASPTDPITAARMETLQAQGRDPFSEYQVPLAVLTLLQGLGRLIRHRTDRGVLAILDPRLRTMGYGRRFLASLPPAPLVHDPDAIRRFLFGVPDGAGAAPRA